MRLIFILICFESIFALEVPDIAKRVAIRTKNAIEEGTLSCYVNFGSWTYQGAMIFRGLWELQSALKYHLDFDIEAFLNEKLDNYLNISTLLY